MRLAGHVERRAPGVVAVLRELKIPALAVEAGNDQADARPRIESPVEQLQLRRARRGAGEAEDGTKTAKGGGHRGRRRLASQQCPRSQVC